MTLHLRFINAPTHRARVLALFGLVLLGACTGGPITSRASKQAVTRLATARLDGAARPVAASPVAARAEITGLTPSPYRTSVAGLHAVPATPPSSAKPPKPASGTANSTTTEVRGSWIDDAIGCTPDSLTPPADHRTTLEFTCTGGTLYTGGLDGHTVLTTVLTYNLVTQDVAGTFDEWFYGTYSGEDGSFGGIHWAGTFAFTGKTSSASIEATILGGTCSFAGATGSGTWTGTAAAVAFGGFVIELTRPMTAPTPSPACNPVGALAAR